MVAFHNLSIDIYRLIVDFLIYNTNSKTMHKLLFIFKNNKEFIKVLFEKFKNTYDQKIPLQITNRINKLYFKNKKEVVFNETKSAFRKKLYPTALLNGYIWYTETKATYSKFGYEMEDKLIKLANIRMSHALTINELKNNLENYIFYYGDLKRKCIHNLDYFELIEDNENVSKRKYKLKNYDCIYKVGCVCTIKQVKLVKLI